MSIKSICILKLIIFYFSSKKKFVTISDFTKELQIIYNKMIKHSEKRHHIYILETLGDVKQSEELKTTPPSRNKRYPKRNIKKVDYTEEDIPEDYYICKSKQTQIIQVWFEKIFGKGTIRIFRECFNKCSLVLVPDLLNY